jgi:hypothetical protein
MRSFKLILILILLTVELGYCQVKHDFLRELKTYFANHRIDSIEGLYTISDDIVIIPAWYEIFSSQEHKVRDHWAKVALIRDSTSLTRDYVELVIEAPNFKEGELRAEYLRTKQNQSLFITKQWNYEKTYVETMMYEFISDGEMLVSSFEYQDGSKTIKLRRTYLKYYPRK